MGSSGPLRHFLAELDPLAPYLCFGIEGAAATHRALPPQELAPDFAGAFGELSAAFSGDEDPSAAAAIFSSWWQAHGEKRFEAPDAVRLALSRLEASQGTARIDEVAEEAGISERHLSRTFGRIVGIPPRTYRRIVQMNCLAAAVQDGRPEVLARLAQDAGFYDQAHFARAVKAFFAMPPKEFIASEDELILQFVARSRAASLRE
nr:helix-turn-helix transcriptional regulator [Parvularcula maris]